MFRRVLASVALVAAATTGLLAVSSAPAFASASGCTAAPGNLFALNCIAVTGTSLTVSKVRGGYHVGIPPVNVCRPTVRFRYVRYATAAYANFVVSSARCGIGATWIDWKPAFRFADKTHLCSQQANDHTSGKFTNYACINIHK